MKKTRTWLSGVLFITMLLIASTGIIQANENVYVWIEAEHSMYHNMPEFLHNPPGQPPLSGDTALIAHSGFAPGEEGFFTIFEVDIPYDGSFIFWINGTVNHSIWSSPFSWRIDDGEWHDMRGVAPVGDLFGPWNAFGWTPIGPLELGTGTVLLELRADDPREGEEGEAPLWVFYLDAIVLTNDETYVPDGIVKP